MSFHTPFILTSLLLGTASDPLVSGLKPGQRPGPYSAVVSVGPKRGQSHCFICETEDRPAVIVFARGLSEPLARLVRGLDRAVTEHKARDLRAWVTFLSDDQVALDPRVVDWARTQAIRNVPLAVFEDAGGPPGYRLHRDADVTVLLFVQQKVVRNFAFRTANLTDQQIESIIQAAGKLK